MSYKNIKEWLKWSEMVKDSKDAADRFYAMSDDDAILQADKKIQSLEQENAELKEAFDLAYNHLCDIHFSATQPICKGSGFLEEAIKEMEHTAKTNPLFIKKKQEELDK